jgi:hypothetical protein
MSGGAAFWIRSNDPEGVRAAILDQVGGWRDVIAESRFVRIENDDHPPRDLLRTLSSSHETDVFWVFAHGSRDIFEYLHFCDGDLMREIVFASVNECTWERLEGVPEPWERWRHPPELGKFDPQSASEAADWVFKHFGLLDTEPDERVSAKSKSAKSKSAESKSAKSKPAKSKSAKSKPAKSKPAKSSPTRSRPRSRSKLSARRRRPNAVCATAS